MMQPPTLGILILNYNGEPWLPPLYRSIQSNGYPNVHVYLVDNASDDGSVEMTLRDHPEVRVLRMPRNLGYCMAYNLAMPYALAGGCEWLVWANPDVLLEPGCLFKLARACQEHPNIGVAGPAFLDWDRDEPNAYMRGNHPGVIHALEVRSETPIDVDWVEGSLLMVSRSCLEKVGLLDPYLHTYWEDADFCRRVRYQGIRVVLVPNARARHYGGAAWTNDDLKSERRRLLARNHYIYKLADPKRNFGRNMLAAIHLFGVRVREARACFPTALEELRYFSKMLLELGIIRKKWLNDRAGRRPALTTAEYQSAGIEILRGEDHFNLAAS